jgi:signal peptidase I
MWSMLFAVNAQGTGYTLQPGRSMEDLQAYIGISEDLLDEFNISVDDLAGAPSPEGVIQMPLTAGAKEALLARKDIVEWISYVPGEDAGGLYPLNKYTGWTTDNYGPVWIPKKGATIDLTLDNLPVYERPIRVYEGNQLDVKDGRIYINGQETTKYTFRMDYYWMMGDNRHNSADSRFWGFVPEDHIVGKPIFVWLSLDKDRGWFDGKIRWNRLFKWVD